MLLFLVWAAQEQRPMSQMHGGCDDYAFEMTRSFALWDAGKGAVSAGRNPAQPGALELDEKVQVELAPMERLSWLVRPPVAKKGFSGAQGGILAFQVNESGLYRLCLSGKIWADVVDVSAAKALDDVQFEMQTRCERIFKVVVFRLEAGKPYHLQLAFSKETKIGVLLTRH